MAVAGFVTLAGVAVALGALVVLHVLDTGLSPVSNAVSEYGITRFRLGYRVQTISLGIGGVAAAVGVHGSAADATLLLAVFGVARMVISWFPMDAPGEPATRTGRLHGLLALAAFLPVTGAAARLERVWSDLTPVGWCLTVGLLLMVVTLFAGPLHRVFGLVERLFYVGMLVFLTQVAVHLVTK